MCASNKSVSNINELFVLIYIYISFSKKNKTKNSTDINKLWLIKYTDFCWILFYYTNNCTLRIYHSENWKLLYEIKFN